MTKTHHNRVSLHSIFIYTSIITVTKEHFFPHSQSGGVFTHKALHRLTQTSGAGLSPSSLSPLPPPFLVVYPECLSPLHTQGEWLSLAECCTLREKRSSFSDLASFGHCKTKKQIQMKDFTLQRISFFISSIGLLLDLDFLYLLTFSIFIFFPFSTLCCCAVYGKH